MEVRTAGAEADLWADALRLDPGAFAGVFDLHRDRVFRHAMRLVEVRADADDVTAMAFTELWRRRDAVRVVDGSVLPWLLVTATNHARNLTRGRFRYRAMLAGLPHAVEPDPAGVAADRIEGRRRAAALRSALASLAPADAALLVLTVLEDATTAQAAAAVGVTPAAARTRLTRARRRLRGALQAAGIEAGEAR